MCKGITVIVAIVALAAAAARADVSGSYADYAEASATSRLARKQYNASVDQMVNKRTQLIEEVHISEGYRAASAAVRKTHTDYEQQRKRVVRDLEKNSTEYKAAMRGRDSVQATINEMRKVGGGVAGFTDLYNSKAVYTEQMRKIEEDALDQAGAGTMKARWEEATAALEALDMDIKIQVERHPEMVAAKQKVEDSRGKLDQSFVDISRSKAAYQGAKADAAYDNAWRNRAYDYFSTYPPSSGHNSWGWYRW